MHKDQRVYIVHVTLESSCSCNNTKPQRSPAGVRVRACGGSGASVPCTFNAHETHNAPPGRRGCKDNFG